MRLTTEQVLKIKVMLAYSVSQKNIAKRFRVSPQVISNIHKGRLHKKVSIENANVTMGVCIACEQVVFDDGQEPRPIYLVREDAYLCNAVCEANRD